MEGIKDSLRLLEEVRLFLNSGDGSGSGFGSGYGCALIEGGIICEVDGELTLIRSVHGNYAVGNFMEDKVTCGRQCYIAKVEGHFAHGDTLREAVAAATNKYLDNSPVEQKIASFRAKFPDADVKYSGKDLFDWHHTLTGSCLAGREQWCRRHNLDPDKDSLTVREFCELTRNDYGGDVIKTLAESYGIKL